MSTSGIRAVVLAVSALVAVAAAYGQSAPGMEGMTVGPSYTRGTNVYPDTGSGPPGSAIGDLVRYHRSHPRHGSKDQICPGAQGDCAPIDIDVAFNGETALGVDVIPDAFRVIAGIGAEELSCEKLSAVKAEVLTAGKVPPNDLASGTDAPADYERWTATLCGKDVAFLLGVWSTNGGHPPFRIVYPFAP